MVSDTASTAAQRTMVEPCLLIRPFFEVVSDSYSLGVIPAHEHRCRAVGNRLMSPISATNMAAVICPTPFRIWMA